MAKMIVTGLDDFLGDMEARRAGLKEDIMRALEAGGEAAVMSIRKETEGFINPSGELAETFEADPPQHYPEKAYIEVWAHGMYTGVRGSPRRAGLVAAIKEYGREARTLEKGKRKKMTPMRPDPFQATGMRKARKKVNAIMAEIIGGMG